MTSVLGNRIMITDKTIHVVENAATFFVIIAERIFEEVITGNFSNLEKVSVYRFRKLSEKQCYLEENHA